MHSPGYIAIGARLKHSDHVLTLGLKPNFSDYSKEEKELIRKASKIYFPTSFYADLFNTMGKETFPSYHTYKFAQDKIKQTAVFEMLKIPHPFTRIFYGTRQKKQILDYFSFPFIAKKARNSSRGCDVFLIENPGQLRRYLDMTNPAYIQEYFRVEKDLRVVIIGGEVALSYWKTPGRGEFRTNISQGGSIRFDAIPPEACSLALDTARKCGWDDVGLDLIEKDGAFYILEANMKYGTKGFKKALIDYKTFLESLLINGRI
ncbi:MAG: RimK family alpha-L-glutamate ligase [Desulfobacteraceae bacterium]